MGVLAVSSRALWKKGSLDLQWTGQRQPSFVVGLRDGERQTGQDSLHGAQLRLHGTLATPAIRVKRPQGTVPGGDRRKLGVRCPCSPAHPFPAPSLSCIWSPPAEPA